MPKDFSAYIFLAKFGRWKCERVGKKKKNHPTENSPHATKEGLRYERERGRREREKERERRNEERTVWRNQFKPFWGLKETWLCSPGKNYCLVLSLFCSRGNLPAQLMRILRGKRIVKGWWCQNYKKEKRNSNNSLIFATAMVSNWQHESKVERPLLSCGWWYIKSPSVW